MVPKASKSTGKKVVIDCTDPVNDRVLELASFEQYLQQRIKVNGKCPAPAGAVSIKRAEKKLTVEFSDPNASKRYIKYLAKKYLKKQQLKDYLRVIMSGKNSYQLKYYKFGGDAAGESAE